MDFKSYFYSLKDEQRASFAARAGTSTGYLSLIASGFRRPGESLAIKLERESNRAVTVEEMRPDVDWAFIRNSSARDSQTNEAA